MSKDLLRRLAKPALGLGLLLLLVSQLDITRLRAVLIEVSLPWFALALVLTVVANVICSFRWKAIVAMFTAPLTAAEALRLYFQGVTANTVLPGGIVGGDIWRTVGLVRKGATKLNAARTVLLDRVSGFWALALLSLMALGLVWVDGSLTGVAAKFAGIYALLLGLVAIGPLIGCVIKLAKESRAVLQTAFFSFGAQLLTMLAFWCCLMAVGASLGFVMLVTVCAGIFLGAVVPASIGGFGSREVAAVAFLTAAGLAPEPGFVASFLFGLTATIQGLGFFIFVLKGHRPKA